MSRDRVKTELGNAVFNAVRGTVNGLGYRLAALVTRPDVEVQRISELETQVKIKQEGLPPRYFLVKVQEKL